MFKLGRVFPITKNSIGKISETVIHISFDVYCVCHNETGPAISWVSGKHAWVLSGYTYKFDDWCLKLNKSPKEKAYFALKYLE